MEVFDGNKSGFCCETKSKSSNTLTNFCVKIFCLGARSWLGTSQACSYGSQLTAHGTMDMSY